MVGLLNNKHRWSHNQTLYNIQYTYIQKYNVKIIKKTVIYICQTRNLYLKYGDTMFVFTLPSFGA